ncbi:hypothetical protein N7462_011397 [Penicillium macrosclerotiorum]|uniref:uncharacterized protein n=1 Tax=Penicillium macrosclerotiorum TaxID=303699 RepID=UPI002548160B|nr:uncharacterized protein N7462_011397 [Penicillium macrosclerotiorum]KAJ5666988.1 hypothetical protein N7462_011397 [Penicillium macrosclerotiorum]
MSSRFPGRQSPEPERQTGPQQRDPPSRGILNGTLSRPAPEYAHELASHGTENLESNPEHPLEKIEAAKFAKGPQRMM